MQHNIVEIIGDVFGRALTLEWAIVAFIVSFALSLIVGRVRFAPVLALLAVVAHQPVDVLINELRAGKPIVGGDLLAALQARFTNPDLAVLGVEFASYTFLIAVMYLSRLDMFRDVVVTEGNVKPMH
jgi:hypothetical protein